MKRRGELVFKKLVQTMASNFHLVKTYTKSNIFKCAAKILLGVLLSLP
jgi:hypothetical protein